MAASMDSVISLESSTHGRQGLGSSGYAIRVGEGAATTPRKQAIAVREHSGFGGVVTEIR